MNIILGSLTAFVVGQLVDAFVFRRIKRITGDKRIWLRATGSTSDQPAHRQCGGHLRGLLDLQRT
jgi:hypothetical protein